MKKFIILFIIIYGCATKSIKIEKKISKPNVVFIFSDDLSFRDISAYGQKNYSTPNIDSLIATSTRFTQAYAGAPECAPSRGTLLTGLHVGHQHIRLNSSARGFEPLPEETYTWGHMFQEAGYKTGIIGKWGLGYHDTSGNPLKQGFDYHFGYLTHYEAHSYFPTVLYENNNPISLVENSNFDLLPLYQKEKQLNNLKFEKDYDENGKLISIDLKKAKYTPDLFDKKASDFIDNNKNNPFLLYFTTNLPHGPTIVDDLGQLKNRKDIDIYAKEWGAMVQRLDITVGKLIKKLKKEGLYENTMIVFASDNGYAMHSPKITENGEKVWLDDKDLTNKGPFKGGKFGVFEGGMRIPFTIKMPNQKSQSVISEPVWLVDLFSTFSSLINHPIDKKTDGHNLIPLINGDKNAIPKNRLMYFYKQNEQAIRQGSWFAYRPHPTKKVELYLIEEDQTMSYNYEKLYPIKAKEFASIMNKEHQESEWYWNPGDNAKIFQEKVKKAKALGLEIKKIRPNNLKLMPWEQ